MSKKFTVKDFEKAINNFYYGIVNYKKGGSKKMTQKNIIKNLEKMGYIVEWRKYGFWQVPFVNNTAIARRYSVNYTQGIQTEFRLLDVLEAIEQGFDSVGDYLDYKKNL